MQAWKTHSRRVVFDQPPWLRVEYHDVELPDGRRIPDWTWIKTPDYINVVVQTKSGQFLCFRQRKYGVAEPMLALVGGYLEPGEAPLSAAQTRAARRDRLRLRGLGGIGRVPGRSQPRRRHRLPVPG